jgi:hypothetical protein
MVGERANPAFEFSIGQLTINVEGVANKSIGEFLRLLMATKLKEVRKTAKCRRKMLWHHMVKPIYRSGPANILLVTCCGQYPSQGSSVFIGVRLAFCHGEG